MSIIAFVAFDFSIGEIILFIALITLLIGVIVTNTFLPDKNPEMIISELQNQGYDVEGIEFVRDKRFNDLLYQSSEPILYEGNHVSFWLFKKALYREHLFNFL